MLIGYARVSAEDQNTQLQTDALEKAGCNRIFREKASGTKTDRPELGRVPDTPRKGDLLVVWKLDRLGRSLPHLIELVADFETRGIGFRSLTENIDTNSATGRMFFHMMGALAQFERDRIRERTLAGLVAARAQGRFGGRPPSLSPEDLETGRAAIAAGESMDVVARRIGVARSTLYANGVRRHAPAPPKRQSSPRRKRAKTKARRR